MCIIPLAGCKCFTMRVSTGIEEESKSNKMNQDKVNKSSAENIT